MRFAVYVEGLAEMQFVADVLEKYSGYDPHRCGFMCINLRADIFERVSFPQQGDENSANYYQIVNVNNDNLVVSKLKKDIPGLLEQGYNVVIGLRDVYSDVYKELCEGQRRIDFDVIKAMHKMQMDAVDDKSGVLRLHFSIMEYEAWMLALIGNYVVERGQEMEQLCRSLGIDMSVDPETTVYHPYILVKEIYKACGESYSKHGKESFSFLSTIGRDDYERLRHSGRCSSFAKFMDSLMPEERFISK